MKTVLIVTAVLVVLAVAALLNYRRYYPKPVSFSDPAYAVEVRSFSVEVNGHTLYCELLIPQGIEGKLPTVVCSHGFNGSYTYFKNSVGMCLAKSGYAVCCFDFYGGSDRGKSGGTVMDMSISSQIGDLNAVIDAVYAMERTDPERFYLWGESQGGLITALTATEHNEDVKGLVLFYPAFLVSEQRHLRYASREDIPENPKLMGKAVSQAFEQECYDLDVYGTIGAYTGPVLIIHGDADKTVDVSYGVRGAETYDNARLEILPGEDHGFSGKGKLQAARLVYEFLTGLAE